MSDLSMFLSLQHRQLLSEWLLTERVGDFLIVEDFLAKGNRMYWKVPWTQRQRLQGSNWGFGPCHVPWADS